MPSRPFKWAYGPPAGEREGPKWDNRKGRSTDAGHWDGAARSSCEGPVMGLEPKGCADQGKPGANPTGEEPRETPKPKVKPFEIDKHLVYQAWRRSANHGAPGVYAVSIKEFSEHERDSLYKLWNRMSSGSYFPGPVRAVEIPKDHGKGVRVLGVPETADRIAQTAQQCFWKRLWSRSSTLTATPIARGVTATRRWRNSKTVLGQGLGIRP